MKDEGMRFSQMNDAMTALFEFFSCDNSERFQARGPDMLREMCEVIPDSGSANPMQDLWDYMKESAKFVNKYYPSSLVRFMAWVRDSQELLTVWSWLRFKCEWVAIECDFLKGKHFREKLILKKTAIEDGHHTDSTKHALHMDAQNLKGCCQNSVAIATMFLSAATHKRTLQVLVTTSAPADEWHSESNKRCRSVEGNSDWLFEQQNGGFFKHLIAVIGVMSDQDVLRRCEFFRV